MPVFIVFVFIIYLSVSRDCVGGFLDRQTTIIQRVVFRAFKVDARCRGKLQKMHKLHGVGDLCHTLYTNMLEKRTIMERLRKKVIG